MNDDTAEMLTCSCCGTGVPNTPAGNASYGEPAHDEGVGECRECYGDPSAKSEKKRMGWAPVMFFDARIPILLKSLSPENAAKFRAMPYRKKCRIIGGLIEKGCMV